MGTETSDAGGDASGAMTIDQAVAALGSLDEDKPEDQDDERQDEAAKDDEVTAEGEDSPEEDQADPEEDDADEGADDDDEDQADEQSEYVADTAKLLDAEGNEITVGELKAGALRHADYTRKTQEVAEKSREAEQRLETLNGYADTLLERVQLAEKVMEFYAPGPPEVSEEEDPVGWTSAVLKYQMALSEHNTLLEHLRDGISRTNEVRSAHTQLTDTSKLEAGKEKLLELVPDLKDPAKKEAIMQDVWATAQEIGFSQEEVGAWSDPRIAFLAIQASRARKLEQARPKAEKKAEGKPPVSGTKKRATPKEGKRARYQDRMKRLASTGSERDAVAALEAADIF